MRTHYFSLLLAISGLAPGVSAAQAVPRTDGPRAGMLRVTFDPVVSAWDNEFTPAGRRPVGAALPAPVFVHAERRVTPLAAEAGITSRISLSVRLPLVRAMIRAGPSPDSSAARATATLDSLLADPSYAYAPIASTRRGLRYFPGDAELAAKVRLGSMTGPYAAAAQVVLRLPTGHVDSPNNLFDLSTGDHQTDLEVGVIQELTVVKRLWLNLSLRGTQQRPGTRERRVAPPDSVLVPYAALTKLAWDPGDAFAVDFAPMYRFNRYFAAGVTASYFTKARDRYTFAGAADSAALATRLGAPRAASVLDAGTSERRVRLGIAVTYLGPNMEGGLSFEQTVSGVGGRIPVMSVFRIVMRTSRWPF
jgi:hypothetical protein